MDDRRGLGEQTLWGLGSFERYSLLLHFIECTCLSYTKRFTGRITDEKSMVHERTTTLGDLPDKWTQTDRSDRPRGGPGVFSSIPTTREDRTSAPI